MQADSVQDFFKLIINDPSQLRKGAETILNRIKNKQQFILDTIEYLTSEEQPSSQQFKFIFNVITLIHPSIIQSFEQLDEKNQEDIRGGLLNCVVTLYKNLKCVAGFGLIIREIIQIDSIQPWLQPFGQLLKWVSSDDPQVVEAGIQFFIFLLKDTQYNKTNPDLPFYKMSAPLLQVLYQLFANSQLSQQIREKILFLVLQLIKTFSIYDGVNDVIVKQSFESTYDIWMSFSSQHYKIIVIVFRDMQKFLSGRQKQQPMQLYIIWEFCYKFLPLHLWSNIWEKDMNQYKNKDSFSNEEDIPVRNQQDSFLYYDDDSEALISQTQSLALTILQFISVLTSIPHLNTTVKVSIHHLTNFLFHFALMSQFDASFWKNNPQQFLAANFMNDYQVNIRNKTISILNQLIQKCGDYAIQAILMISQKFLLNLSQLQTTQSVKQIMQNVIDIKTLPELSSHIYENSDKLINLVKLSSCDIRNLLHVSGQTWKKMEVALVVLGRFAEDIIVFQSKQQGAFDIESFVKGLIKQVKDQEFYELLKGQSLYCLTRFTQIISIKYRGLFPDLAIGCMICLKRNNPISVKSIATRALTLFLRKIQKHKLQFTQQQKQVIKKLNILQSLLHIPLYPQITNIILQSLIQTFKNGDIGSYLISSINNQIYPEYLLAVFHKNITHTSTIQLFFTLLQQICKTFNQYKKILEIFIKFIEECLKSYCNIIGSEEQLKYLKNADVQLILIVLKITNVLIVRGGDIGGNIDQNGSKVDKSINAKFIMLVPLFSEIIKSNNDVQIHIQTTICYKNIVKMASQQIKNNQQLINATVQTIKNLLKIPKDKTFESASVFAGNLVILTIDKILSKLNYEILQQAVLKVFRSRTPSVIQSLVLIYSRLMNINTDQSNFYLKDIEAPFSMNMQNQIIDLIDFLSSFSIENRMGLKILIDKWLLQQSLFRGRYTKISTFMALSKLFLIGDKRIDNLLVIGFNPSHVNVSNDVNAPLKILATLIRCLDNERGIDDKNEIQSQQEEEQKKQDLKTVDVTLEKFKENQDQQDDEGGKVQGGLADRENQQGSTCYMSAMLEFYDDGEQCDQTTQEDLIFLKDSSTNFVLADYLIEFFNYLVENKKEYFKECLKGILKEDVKTLGKYVKID